MYDVLAIGISIQATTGGKVGAMAVYFYRMKPGITYIFQNHATR